MVDLHCKSAITHWQMLQVGWGVTGKQKRKRWWCSCVISSSRFLMGILSACHFLPLTWPPHHPLYTPTQTAQFVLNTGHNAECNPQVSPSHAHGHLTTLSLQPLTGRKHQLRRHCADVLGCGMLDKNSCAGVLYRRPGLRHAR